MPTFDFQCLHCGHVFEFTRPFGSNQTPSGEECQSINVMKLIAPPAIHFKGEGFYKTDNSVTPKKEEKTDEKKPKKEEKKDVTKNDSNKADDKKS